MDSLRYGINTVIVNITGVAAVMRTVPQVTVGKFEYNLSILLPR